MSPGHRHAFTVSASLLFATVALAQVQHEVDRLPVFGVDLATDGQAVLIYDRESDPVVHVRQGDSWIEQGRLVQPTADDHYGMDIEGDLAATCSRQQLPDSVLVSWVTVYRRAADGGWSLSSESQEPCDDVALADGRLYVGRTGTGIEGGIGIHVETGDGSWSLETTLVAPDPDHAFFGARLVVEGDRLVATAIRWDDHSVLHVFVREDGVWRPEGELVPDDLPPWSLDRPDDWLTSIALDGSLVAVGDRSDPLSIGGLVRTFRLDDDGWRYEGPLIGSRTDEDDVFGISVALSGGRLVVGACEDEVETPTGRVTPSGTATLFEQGPAGWQECAVVGPESPGGLTDFFGMGTVFLSDGRTLIGSREQPVMEFDIESRCRPPEVSSRSSVHPLRLRLSVDGSLDLRFEDLAELAESYSVHVGTLGDWTTLPPAVVVGSVPIEDGVGGRVMSIPAPSADAYFLVGATSSFGPGPLGPFWAGQAAGP